MLYSRKWWRGKRPTFLCAFGDQKICSYRCLEYWLPITMVIVDFLSFSFSLLIAILNRIMQLGDVLMCSIYSLYIQLLSMEIYFEFKLLKKDIRCVGGKEVDLQTSHVENCYKKSCLDMDWKQILKTEVGIWRWIVMIILLWGVTASSFFIFSLRLPVQKF